MGERVTWQLDIFASTPSDAPPERQAAPATIGGRFRAFDAANPHVLAEMLRLARARLDRGERYISVKALWEELRRALAYRHEVLADGEYKLNNNYTALYARRLLDLEPRLDGVIATRRRKSE
jgi:hypothetical protein